MSDIKKWHEHETVYKFLYSILASVTSTLERILWNQRQVYGSESKETHKLCIWPIWKEKKYVFFLNLSIVSFPKLVNMTKNTPFFPILHVFCTPKQCTRLHCLVLKNNPNYVNFFMRMISNFKYKCPPPPGTPADRRIKTKTRCHWDFTDCNAHTNSFTWVTPCPWIVKRCERDYHVTIPSFTNNFCWNLWRSDWVL